jgi:hypothetical protein
MLNGYALPAAQSCAFSPHLKDAFAEHEARFLEFSMAGDAHGRLFLLP